MDAIINSFIYASFNYCPLVWHFCSYKSSLKIEQIQKRCLRAILDDYTSDYKTLSEKGKTSTMNIKSMRILANEIFRTINNINLSFINDNFTCKVNLKVQPNNLSVKSCKTTKYGTKGLTTLGPQIWNTLPQKH